jgi:hypothetical protein
MTQPNATTLPQAYDDALARLPEAQRANASWRACLLILSSRPTLMAVLAKTGDLDQGYIDTVLFARVLTLSTLTHSDNILGHLALHLFSFSYHLPYGGLHHLRALDKKNFELAIQAIRLAMGTPSPDGPPPGGRS